MSAFARKLDRLAERHKRLHHAPNLSTLHNCPVGSDVTLHIGPQKLRLYAHEDVLNASSTYFQLMLDRDSPFIEAKTRIVYKPTWNWDSAFALTHFMYTAELDVTADLLPPIYLAADEAQVLPLLAELHKQEKSFYRLLSDPWSAAAMYCFAELAELQRLSRFAHAYLQVCGQDASNKYQTFLCLEDLSAKLHVCTNSNCGLLFRIQNWPIRISTKMDGSRVIDSKNQSTRSPADGQQEFNTSLPPAFQPAFSVTVENVPAEALIDLADGRADLGANLSAVVFKGLSSFTGEISLDARKFSIKSSGDNIDGDKGSSASTNATVNRSAEEAVASLLDNLRRCNKTTYTGPLSSPTSMDPKPLTSDTVITGVFSKKTAFMSAQRFLHSLVKGTNLASEKDPNHDASVRPYQNQTFSLRVIVGTDVAQLLRKSAERLRARTGCRYFQNPGPTVGYFLNGADPASTFTLEGRPFQILQGLTLLEDLMVTSPQSPPSSARALYDSRGSLKITAPKLPVLKGLLETQTSFGYDLKANALYLIRPPEELKTILENLSIFTGDIRNPVSGHPLPPYPMNSSVPHIKHLLNSQNAPASLYAMTSRSPSKDTSRTSSNNIPPKFSNQVSDGLRTFGTSNSKYTSSNGVISLNPSEPPNQAIWNRSNNVRYNDPFPTPPNSPTKDFCGTSSSSSNRSNQPRNETSPPPLQEETESVLQTRDIKIISLHVPRKIIHLVHPPHNHRV